MVNKFSAPERDGQRFCVTEQSGQDFYTMVKGGNMTIEEALNTAIEFETRVRSVYEEALKDETDPSARRTLEVLAREEGYHLEYLKKRKEEWLANGHISIERLETSVPSPDLIARGVKTLRERLAGKRKDPNRSHVLLLQRAQKVEEETSAFYRRLVGQLEGTANTMFERFLEIEDGHLALVSAELDTVQGLGFWFDVQEFDLEAG
jgi:rubrerythrin